MLLEVIYTLFIMDLVFIILAWLPREALGFLPDSTKIFFALFAVVCSGALTLGLFDVEIVTNPHIGLNPTVVYHDYADYPLSFIFMGFVIIMILRGSAMTFQILADAAEARLGITEGENE